MASVLVKACWTLRFQFEAYGTRRFGLIVKALHGLGSLGPPTGVRPSPHRTAPELIGKTGPAVLQLRLGPENVKDATAILPLPGTVTGCPAELRVVIVAPVGTVVIPVKGLKAD